MSDSVQIALIAGVAAAVPAMLVAWLGYMKARKTEATIEKTAATVDIVHTLVNSQMGEQLRIGMVAARTLANVTKAPADMNLADEAERKYSDHQAKQAVVDAKPA